MFKLSPLIISLTLAVGLPATTYATATPPKNAAVQLIERQEVKDFINEMHTQHQFNKAELTKLFSQIQIQPSIIKSISSPAEAKPWHQYKKIFLGDKRIKQGVSFWNKHSASLARAEKTYGVPAEIIVAILGVETHFGTYKGKHKVLDALATLAFDYSPRAKFFRKELKEYLLLTKEEKLNPNQLKGSYAGAMGAPQFIASSYRQYAVDFSGTGQRDLINDIDDAIGSIANYFKMHGWKAKQPVIMQAKTKGNDFKKYIASKANPKPKYTFKELSSHGITIDGNNAGTIKNANIALIELDEKAGPTHWLGLNNFYVITRYNHSSHYAMAVYELSQRIKSAKKG